MVIKRVSANVLADEIVTPADTHRTDLGLMPKYRLPDHGAWSGVAERLVYDELMLDGNARLNLATFVTTWMEPQAEALMKGIAPALAARIGEMGPFTIVSDGTDIPVLSFTATRAGSSH